MFEDGNIVSLNKRVSCKEVSPYGTTVVKYIRSFVHIKHEERDAYLVL